MVADESLSLTECLNLIKFSYFSASSDGEADDSMAETSPDIESPKTKLFNTSNANSLNLSPCASPCLSARINEHKENIAMTMMHKRGQSPDDFS